MNWFRHLKYVWYYPTVIIILILVGFFSTAYVYFKVGGFEKQSLLRRTDSLAKAINVDEIRTLSGDESDLQNPAYIVLKEKFKAIKAVNPDTRFVYLTGKKNGQVYFMVDSEDPDSDSYSPPGQIYPEASVAFNSEFDASNSILEGPVRDRWGNWISALSPIVDPQTGQTYAVIGMDIDAGSYMKTVWLYSAIPLFVTFLLLALVSIGWVVRKEEEKIIAFKSEMVSVASHDIRSPLNGILWSLEIFLKKFAKSLTSEQRSDLENTYENGKRLLSTLNEYLLLSPLEKEGVKKLNISECDISQLIKKTVADFDLVAKNKSVEIVINDSIDALAVHSNSGEKIKCDPDKMKRVFSNILDNAIKYSKANSKVEIDFTEEDGYKVVSFTDHGIGIDPKDREKIWRGFFRAENAKQFASSGTGLGLYYAKKVVDLHGGKIWLESKENTGTTLCVALK